MSERPWSFDLTVAADHEVKPNPTPKPPTQPHLAYDRLQLKMLAAALAAASEATVAAALSATAALLGQHETAWRVHDEGLLEVLGELAAPEADSSSAAFSVETRRAALRCLELALAAPVARADSLRAPAVHDALRDALGDARDATRRALAYAALASCGDAVDSSVAAVELGFLAALVARLRDELAGYAAQPLGAELTDAVLLALRRLLAHTSQAHSADQVLDTAGAIGLLLECLTVVRVGEATQALALGCLATLAGEARGKLLLLAEGAAALDLLLARCRSPSATIAAPAAGVLMGLLIEDDGKRAVLAASDWPALVELVRVGAPVALLLNACTAIGALAAHPKGREALLEPLDAGTVSGADRLRAVAEAEGSAPSVKKAASRALATVLWTPQ